MAPGNIIKPWQKAAQRRLASARWSNEGDRLPSANIQINILQNIRVSFISKGHPVIVNISTKGSNVYRAVCICHIRLSIHDLYVSFKAGDTFRIALDNRADFFNRTNKNVSEQQKSDEFSIGQLTPKDEPCAANHYKQGHEPH
ncbi:hypothetical protein D3C80_1031990 [compost metagenome]